MDRRIKLNALARPDDLNKRSDSELRQPHGTKEGSAG